MDEAIVQKVVESTGLSTQRVSQILKEWVIETGKSPQDLSLEDFREVLVHILQNVFAQIAEGEHQYIKISG